MLVEQAERVAERPCDVREHRVDVGKRVELGVQARLDLELERLLEVPVRNDHAQAGLARGTEELEQAVGGADGDAAAEVVPAQVPGRPARELRQPQLLARAQRAGDEARHRAEPDRVEAALARLPRGGAEVCVRLARRDVRVPAERPAADGPGRAHDPFPRSRTRSRIVGASRNGIAWYSA